MLETFWKMAALEKKTQSEAATGVVTCEFCEISKNTFVTEHLRTTDSED